MPVPTASPRNTDLGVDDIPSRPGSAVYEKGQKRLLLILRCAERRIVTDGYGKLSMRQVARDADVSLAALQYYFPTMQSLISALLQHLVSKYKAEIRSIPELSTEDSIKRFNSLATFYLVDLKSDYRRRLFAELWAFALRDSEVARALDDMTSVYQSRFEKAVADVNGDLTPAQIRRRARLIIAQIDGLNQYAQRENAGAADVRDFERDARRQLLALAVSP